MVRYKNVSDKDWSDRNKAIEESIVYDEDLGYYIPVYGIQYESFTPHYDLGTLTLTSNHMFIKTGLRQKVGKVFTMIRLKNTADAISLDGVGCNIYYKRQRIPYRDADTKDIVIIIFQKIYKHLKASNDAIYNLTRDIERDNETLKAQNESLKSQLNAQNKDPFTL